MSDLWAEFNEAREAYESYLADPYVAGSDEDTDCTLEHLVELADKSIALVDHLKATMQEGGDEDMGKHHVDLRLWRRWNRVVKTRGMRMHYFRVNVPDGVYNAWFVNDR